MRDNHDCKSERQYNRTLQSRQKSSRYYPHIKETYDTDISSATLGTLLKSLYIGKIMVAE